MNFLLPSLVFARRSAAAVVCVAGLKNKLFMKAQNHGEPPGWPVS
jgi:hypothetical protein